MIPTIASLAVGKHSCHLSAGGKAHQGVVLWLHAKFLCMGRDIFHRPGQVLQGSIVAHIHPDAVPQHEHPVPHIMELGRRCHTLPQLAAGKGNVAAQHHRKFGVCLLRREIIQFHRCLGWRGGDLLLRVDLVGYLTACIVVFYYQVQGCRTVLCLFLACVFCQGLVLKASSQQCAAIIGVAKGEDARLCNAGVLPDLLHRGLGCDGAGVFRCPHRQVQAGQLCQAHCPAQQLVVP